VFTVNAMTSEPKRQRHANAIVLIAACAFSTWAVAQNSSKQQPKTVLNCPAARDLPAAQLYGVWAVRFDKAPAGLPATATLQLQRHAEFSESLAGSVIRELGASAGSSAIAGHAARAALAGDLEEGVLMLDESSNNVNITGTWNAEMAAGSCGKRFTGSWKDTSSSAPADAAEISFTMTKQP
jgi:hypothetical protein